jgi:PAS domain S-box-containing protein
MIGAVPADPGSRPSAAVLRSARLAFLSLAALAVVLGVILLPMALARINDAANVNDAAKSRMYAERIARIAATDVSGRRALPDAELQDATDELEKRSAALGLAATPELLRYGGAAASLARDDDANPRAARTILQTRARVIELLDGALTPRTQQLSDATKAIALGVVVFTLLLIVGAYAILRRILVPLGRRLDASEAERQEAEKVRFATEERFRLMVEDVEDYAILMLDAQGNVATWNAGSQRFKGYRAGEILGRHFSVFYLPEDVAAGRPERELEIAAAQGRVEDEGWRVRRDGTRFWANVVITALRDHDGALRGYGKITRDLTERREAELALRASERRFSRFFEEAPIGMIIVDLAGRYERVNDAFCSIIGLSRERLTAGTRHDITHPDDVAGDEARLRSMLAGETTSAAWEKRYAHASGRTVWASISVALLREPDGRPLHFIAQVEDITERRTRAERDVAEQRRAEELRMRSAEFGQHALGTAAVADLKQQAVELVARTIGAPYVRLGELDAAGTSIVFSAGVGWPAHLIEQHPLAVSASPQCEESIRSGRPVFLERADDSNLLRPSHESAALGIIGSATIPIRGRDAVVGVLHVGLPRVHAFTQDDVTFLAGIGTIVSMVIDRDRREQRIGHLNVDLRNRYAELETFSYSVAHDLRGPLRAVSGFAGALEEDYGTILDDEAKRYIRLIANGACEMDKLIDALLSLARVSRLELSRSRVDLTASARSIVRELRSANPGRNVDAVVEDGLVVHGDPALLRNLLANLLGNAWKFTRERDLAVIRLESRVRDRETVYALTDNGIGFPTSQSAELFAPFKRLHAKGYEGTGIGLATVARIVQRHGGRVWAESEQNAGATFSFTLG